MQKQKATISDFHILIGQRDALEGQLKLTQMNLDLVNQKLDEMAHDLAEQATTELDSAVASVGADSDYPVPEELLYA